MFSQTAGTVTGETLAFDMNRNPATRINVDTNWLIYQLTYCMYVENGHGVSSTQTFKIKLKCGSDYTVTLPTEM